MQGASAVLELLDQVFLVAMIVCGELAYLFDCRSLTRSLLAVGLFSNPWTWAGAGLMVALQVAFTYVPTMNRLFETAPIDGTSWAAVALLSLLISAAVAVEKTIWGVTRHRASAKDRLENP